MQKADSVASDIERRQLPRWRRSPADLSAGLIRVAGREVRAARSGLLRSNFADFCAHLLQRRILHCFGDSHAMVFAKIRELRFLPSTWIDVNVIGGATALGLANPRSKTRALPRFEHVIREIPRDRALLFMLGEVDCGFLIWYRSQKLGVSPMSELDRSVRNYLGFMERLLADDRRNLVVAAAPPPTILDGQSFGEVAHARREVTATLSERTDLTVAYNARLQEWADAHDCVFLNYQSEVLDPNLGRVRDEFRNRDPLDHHLAPESFAELIAGQLREIGFC